MGGSCQSYCSRGLGTQVQPDTEKVVGVRAGSLYAAGESSRRTPLPQQHAGHLQSLHTISYSTTLDLSHTPSSQQQEGSSRNAIMSDFALAVKAGNDTVVMSMLEDYPGMALADMHVASHDTILICAVRHKRYNIVDVLLADGSFINDQNATKGDTALHVATRLGDVRMVKLLLKHFADPEIQNMDAQSSIQVASSQDFKLLVKILSDKVKSWQKKSKRRPAPEGRLPLYQATSLPSIRGIRKPKPATPGAINTLSIGNLRHHGAQSSTANVPDLANFGSCDTIASDKSMQNADTPVLDAIADEILDGIGDSVRSRNDTMQTLQGWLQKQQGTAPHQWLKRYVVIQDGYLLWHDRQMSIEHGVTYNEKKRWSKCIIVRRVNSVSIMLDKKQCKFKICVKGSQGRDYIFKAKGTAERDYWVRELKARVANARMASLCR